ncbi:chaperonin 10-like protein [Irpex rosettiformis]|uniref:Chaperonin 10-like protein n=1 Tax=Irpex rosettiformis TaxID=378272 RepID=A0ACB8TZL4_9APHY|nr:chaperonin 10-like protein [Irpex rosettiformis]
MTLDMQVVVKFHPPAYDIRVENAPIPGIEHPDDAIVKVQLAGLCGSDLHVYRGHEDVDKEMICGHEFIGTVIALGSNFGVLATGRPSLYATLKLGDKVVAPFTVSCGECHFCRIGFTSRCIHSTLFGTPSLPGGQAQFVRVPKAGGTLFKVDDIAAVSPNTPLDDSSLLLLADILPTGVFAAIQPLQHAKLAAIISGIAYPLNGYLPEGLGRNAFLSAEDTVLTLAVVGLGPVGMCATVSLLDMLEDIRAERGVQFRIVTMDLNGTRREKMLAMVESIYGGQAPPNIAIADLDAGRDIINEWTGSLGCNAVLEVVGNNSALRLAYDIVQPFGVISTVGVHQGPPLPFIGREMYDKNVSFDFGRCPVRAMLPMAARILLKRQDVFAGVGGKTSLIEKIVGFEEAVDTYRQFDKGLCGKTLFDPWKK